MFDTHCHLNFSAFNKNLPDVIKRAHEVGVDYFVVPGTDVKRSMKAMEVAQKYENVYAAVGIHPHHVYKLEVKSEKLKVKEEIKKLLMHPKVVAIGEVGMDKHVYTQTTYKDYRIDNQFIEAQKELFIMQIQLAIEFNKTLIIHNREAKEDLLEILSNHQSLITDNKIVFHCCEPDAELLEFAKQHKMFIGVDGDVTYSTEKQEFVKQIPLDMLVLETDSPFLLPEPLRSQKQFPNEPKNISIIASFIAQILGRNEEEIKKITTENARKLFTFPSSGR